MGPDVVVVPRQDGAQLNFFVYLHVEVDGQPWPKVRISHLFTYVNVEEETGT